MWPHHTPPPLPKLSRPPFHRRPPHSPPQQLHRYHLLPLRPLPWPPQQCLVRRVHRQDPRRIPVPSCPLPDQPAAVAAPPGSLRAGLSCRGTTRPQDALQQTPELHRCTGASTRARTNGTPAVVPANIPLGEGTPQTRREASAAARPFGAHTPREAPPGYQGCARLRRHGPLPLRTEGPSQTRPLASAQTPTWDTSRRTLAPSQAPNGRGLPRSTRMGE
mmetsp:Transcript_12635/g.25120  ORF Transcript_12635/g.25120 Transcript_12635/m.25120 type:complete len:219 (-) Transcript_12635:1577-2233(-)